MATPAATTSQTFMAIGVLFWYLDRRLPTSPVRVSPFVGSDGS
jgi:hypothetical protein